MPKDHEDDWLPPVLMRCGPLVPTTRGRTQQGHPFIAWRPVEPMSASLLNLRTIYISGSRGRPSALLYEYVMDTDEGMMRFRGLYGDPEADDCEPWVPNSLEIDLGLPEIDE